MCITTFHLRTTNNSRFAPLKCWGMWWCFASVLCTAGASPDGTFTKMQTPLVKKRTGAKGDSTPLKCWGIPSAPPHRFTCNAPLVPPRCKEDAYTCGEEAYWRFDFDASGPTCGPFHFFLCTRKKLRYMPSRMGPRAKHVMRINAWRLSKAMLR